MCNVRNVICSYGPVTSAMYSAIFTYRCRSIGTNLKGPITPGIYPTIMIMWTSLSNGLYCTKRAHSYLWLIQPFAITVQEMVHTIVHKVAIVHKFLCNSIHCVLNLSIASYHYVRMDLLELWHLQRVWRLSKRIRSPRTWMASLK